MKKELTILLTVTLQDDVWSFSIELARQLQRFSIKFIFAIIDGSSGLAHRKDLVTVRNVVIVENYFGNKKNDIWAEHNPDIHEWLLLLESRTEPDIIHVHEYVLASIHWVAPVIVTGHMCMCTLYESILSKVKDTTLESYRQKVIVGLSACDYVVVPSFWMRKQLKHLYGHSGRATVIYHQKQPLSNTEQLKKNLVISIGSFDDKTMNLKIVENISTSIEWPVVIAGKNDFFHKKCILNDYICFMSQFEILELLSASKIFVCPVYYDPTGMSIFSAAFSGCAIITGDIESMREIWEDSVLYMDSDNPEELLYLCQMLIKNPQQCNYYGSKVKNQLSHYTMSSMGREYFSIYMNVIEKYQKELDRGLSTDDGLTFVETLQNV